MRTPTPRLRAASARSVDLGRAPSGALEDLVGETMLYLHLTARRHGLTLVQLVVLRLLDKAGPIHPSVLAEHLGISRPAATSSLDILEGAGWVVRSRAAGDRRSLQARLTPRAARMLAAVARDRRSFLERGLGVLTSEERAELLRLASRVVGGLRDLRPSLDPPARRPNPQ